MKKILILIPLLFLSGCGYGIGTAVSLLSQSQPIGLATTAVESTMVCVYEEKTPDEIAEERIEKIEDFLEIDEK